MPAVNIARALSSISVPLTPKTSARRSVGLGGHQDRWIDSPSMMASANAR